MSIFDRDKRGILKSPLNGTSILPSDISYTNPRIPTAFNGDVEKALNYLTAAVYPNYKSTVANQAALPVSGTVNDLVIVTDDGDGKMAGYVWTVVDGVSGWNKRYDVDWTFEGILGETVNRTQYMYMHKYGFTDHNAAGTPIVGTYAGQTVYGGDLTNQNLTLNANSADTTGYVQTDNHFRPTANNTIDLGTSANKFRTGYLATSALIATLTLSAGSIVDSSGTISFDNENLVTTGNVTSTIGYATSRVEVGPLAGAALILAPGSITDESGAIDFGNENLTTTGSVNSSSAVLANITITTDSIISSGGAIDFASNDLSTGGTITTTDTLIGSNLSITNTADFGLITISGNTIQNTDPDGNLIIQADGIGTIDFQNTVNLFDANFDGLLAGVGQLTIDNLSLNGNTISSTDTNGNLNISPNGAGTIITSSLVKPSVDNSNDLGATSFRFKSLYLSNSISDGTTSISQATLQSFRDAIVGVNSGDALFWNGSKWVPSAPDTEITHNTLSGLTTTDAGHTQFVMLAGRSGGQTIQGGTGAGEHLILESTANASKGLVKTKNNLVPNTTAAYSAGWTGTDLGGTSNYWNDIYSKGEHKGLRFENYAEGSLPAGSAQNTGRALWSTDTQHLWVDNGGTLVKVGGAEKWSSDTSWNGSDTTKDVNVSAQITDARTALWQLCDNSNDYERIFTSIKATSSTTVRITVSPALPAGSYRLIGVN